MSKGMMTLLAVVVGVALLVGVPVISYFTAWSAGNRAEQNIAARWEDNENVLAQYMQKVKETAQVPGMQRDDLIAVFTGANESRYGKTGSAATMQWIREQNPNLDQATYRQIQQVIEAGRNEFKNVQSRLAYAKRSLRTQLGSPWRGFWMRQAGDPTIKIGYPIGAQGDHPLAPVGGA